MISRPSSRSLLPTGNSSGTPFTVAGVSPPSTATSHLVSTYRKIVESSASEGLAAVVAYEMQAPLIAASKADGLRRNYGIDAEGTRFWDLHATMDTDHARCGDTEVGSATEPPPAAPPRQSTPTPAASSAAAGSVYERPPAPAPPAPARTPERPRPPPEAVLRSSPHSPAPLCHDKDPLCRTDPPTRLRPRPAPPRTAPAPCAPSRPAARPRRRR